MRTLTHISRRPIALSLSLALALVSALVLALLVDAPARAEPYFSPEQAPAARVGKTVVVSGLDHPWAMAWLPDGGLLITERPGRVRLLRDGRLTEVPGAPDPLVHGQGGLLDVSLPPLFEANRLVYFTLA